MHYDHLCFSLIGNERTLDLRAESMLQVNRWVRYFRSRLFKLKESSSSTVTVHQPLFQDYLNTVWKEELLRDWPKYFDAENNLPR
jgi:hypothetical protein